MATTYQVIGNIRGWCGHAHRTLKGASACLRRDQNGCRSQGGYSDRHVEMCDGDAVIERVNPDDDSAYYDE